jgi:DNA replicative helicase MCM subunit Mcm2 (Cdc46/Mcm family)
MFDHPQGYTTARTLLSILRLSESLARLRWSDQVHDFFYAPFRYPDPLHL